MNTQFEKEGPIQGPAVERKASWTYEDRDYIWLSRLTYVFTPAAICILFPTGLAIVIEAIHADGIRQAAIFIGFVLWQFFGAMAVGELKWKYGEYLSARFPGSRVRYLYDRPFFDNSTLEYLRRPNDNDRRAAAEQRNAALEPLRKRVARYKKLFRGAAITQFTAGIVCVFWLHTPAVPGAPGLLTSAIGFLLLLGSLLPTPAWQIMIYDLPARWNPMYVPITLPPAMTMGLSGLWTIYRSSTGHQRSYRAAYSKRRSDHWFSAMTGQAHPFRWVFGNIVRTLGKTCPKRSLP